MQTVSLTLGEKNASNSTTTTTTQQEQQNTPTLPEQQPQG